MQLRPQIANYELSIENPRDIKYNLDVSLFERLCLSGVSSSKQGHKFPMTQLTVQRRMRPEIADLVRMTLYNELLDHPSVCQYPHVMGMYHNLYWFDHSNHEDQTSPQEMKQTSQSNKFEVDMATQLVSHLNKQGCYKDGDLAVITPYLGQLRKLRNSLAKTFSVRMLEKDVNDLAGLESLEHSPTIEAKPLAESVRIATVLADLRND